MAGKTPPRVDELGEELERIMSGDVPDVPEGLEDYVVDEVPHDRLALDLWIDRRLVAIAMIDAEIEHNEAVARARIQEIETWLASENRPLDRKREFLEQQVLAAARIYPYGKKKSRRLPSGGEIGSHRSAERVTLVDEAAALEFAKGHPGLAHDVKVKESIGTKALNDYYRSTGEVPPGCDLVPAEDRYFVKPPKRQG